MNELFFQDKKYLLNVYNKMNLEIVGGKGSYLYDSRGNKYLDMFSGIAVNGLGLDQDELKERIKEQLDRYMHLSNYFASEAVIDLARLLVENTFSKKVFFANSGSEVNEAALKLARKYGKEIDDEKIEIAAAHNSFHGRTTGSLSLTGRDKYKDEFRPLLPGIKHFDFNDSRDLKAKISEKTCAVFIEVIQGEGGIYELDQSFLDKLTELADEFDFLIILDEIQTGMGRTGDFLAYEKFDLKPDLVTMAKSLGGGLPLGALLVSKRLEDVFGPGDHGSTFGGNPLACTAGSYLVETVLDKDFQKDLKERSNLLLDELNNLKSSYSDIIEETRGRGMMIGIETGDYAPGIKKKALEKNLLLNVTDDTVIRLLPALNIKREEIEEFIMKFSEVLNELK